MSRSALVDAIDALLPQTQCTKCGYAGCRPYAEAIASGDADINRCPPGGAVGISKLAALLGREIKPLDPGRGTERPRHIAVIDEELCIGCTLCIQACPVDAIIGAAKQMHTVVSALCTGCDLCVAPCPVDCIRMVRATGNEAIWDRDRADAARQRFEARKLRLERERAERARRLHDKASGIGPSPGEAADAIRAAIERARAKRALAMQRNAESLPRETEARPAEADVRGAASKEKP